eukprot:4109539-Lingulodinium_polyedra.AAC.1
MYLDFGRYTSAASGGPPPRLGIQQPRRREVEVVGHLNDPGAPALPGRHDRCAGSPIPSLPVP